VVLMLSLAMRRGLRLLLRGMMGLRLLGSKSVRGC
jgi:hypothetical protein